MSLSQLDLYNGALLLLKSEQLLNLTENREPRYKLDLLWNEGAGSGSSIFNACLSKAEWVFAKRTVRLDYDSGITPQFGYRYACDKPSDYVRLMALSTDEFFDATLNQYNEEGAYFFSSYQQLYLRYVSNDPAWGMNTARWPQVFIEYVKAYMASKIAGRITGSSVSVEEIRKEKVRCLAQAQGENAIERPASFPTRGSWVLARHGRRGLDRYRRG